MPFSQGPTSVSERRSALSAEVHCKPLHPQMSRIHNENVSYTQPEFPVSTQQNLSQRSWEKTLTRAERASNSETVPKDT